jgi:predicted ester cyclase
MPHTDHLDLAARFYAAFDSGTPARMDDVLAADAIDHDGPGGDEPARATMRGLVAMLAAGFTAYRHTLELVLPVAPDKVFIRWRMAGTHTGDVYGIPASGKRVDFCGHDLVRIENGLIAEVWHIEQLLALVHQIQPR